MELIEVVSQGTMKEAARIVNAGRFPALTALQAQDPSRYYGLVAASLRQALKDCITGMLEECAAAVNAHVGEGWLRVIINTQCTDVALYGLKMAANEAQQG